MFMLSWFLALMRHYGKPANYVIINIRLLDLEFLYVSIARIKVPRAIALLTQGHK